MSIVYVRFGVSFHGLDYDQMAQVEAMRAELDRFARTLHHDLDLVEDVEVEIDEYAGKPVGDKPTRAGNIARGVFLAFLLAALGFMGVLFGGLLKQWMAAP